MATFARGAVMQVNRIEFSTDGRIRSAHEYLGMSAAPGALGGLTAVVDAEHFTEAETVIEGRIRGTHSGEFLGHAPTGREVAMRARADEPLSGEPRDRASDHRELVFFVASADRFVDQRGVLCPAPGWVCSCGRLPLVHRRRSLFPIADPSPTSPSRN